MKVDCDVVWILGKCARVVAVIISFQVKPHLPFIFMSIGPNAVQNKKSMVKNRQKSQSLYNPILKLNNFEFIEILPDK